MATIGKVQGFKKPAAATPVVLYTVPGSTQANTNLFVANQGTVPDYIRVALTQSGSALAVTDYIAWDVRVNENTSINFTGLALGAGDFITVRSLNGDCSFVATGLEIA